MTALHRSAPSSTSVRGTSLRAGPRTALALAAIALSACISPKRPVGSQCDLTSDCEFPLVCRLSACRNECREDRDCPRGTYCAADNAGYGTCLLPAESSCVSDIVCPPTLACAVELDGVCRRPCLDDRACLRLQACVQSFCVDIAAGAGGDGGVGPLPDGGGGGPDGGAGDGGVGECIEPRLDCNGEPADGCEVDPTSDITNCGICGRVCRDTALHAGPACLERACTVACLASYDDCNGNPDDGCESELDRDEANCRTCGRSCGARICIGGSCMDPPYPTMSTEVLAPMPADAGSGDAGTATRTIFLPAGRHEFASIHVPSGYTLRIDPNDIGTGVLELISRGDIVIEGTIDLSGGAGGTPVLIGSSQSGGATGAPRDGSNSRSCIGVPSIGGSGDPGETAPGAAPGCALGGEYGGGMSGSGASGGGGGGGYAGGGGGSSPSRAGGAGGGVGTDRGGEGGAPCAGGGGGEAPGVYAGGDGEGNCEPLLGGAGGGGSIGAAAANDLAVTSRTFHAGSAGGGAGSTAVGSGGGGGGGGGGALRLASATRIVITGSILAEGGPGGAGSLGGGGGSGGVVVLSAPELEVSPIAEISVDGGAGGYSSGGARGGDGGRGRIRISTDPGACQLAGRYGEINPPSSCAPTPTPEPGRIYIGAYPE